MDIREFLSIKLCAISVDLALNIDIFSFNLKHKNYAMDTMHPQSPFLAGLMFSVRTTRKVHVT